MNGEFFSDFFLPATLATIMLGMGLSLTADDFKNIWQQPRGIVIGLICQLVLVPLIACILAYFANVSSAVKVGLVLIASCPGGISSGLVTHLFRGNVALSIALVSVNSFITLLSIPVMVNLALSLFMGETHSISLPITTTAFEIFALTVLPAATGVFLRKKFPQPAIALERPLRYIMPIMLFVAFAGVMLGGDKKSQTAIADFLSLLPYALLLNFLGIMLTFAVTVLTGLNKTIQITLPTEAGLHNSSLAIYIAGSILGNADMALVAVVYGAITFFSTIIFLYAIYYFFINTDRYKAE